MEGGGGEGAGGPIHKAKGFLSNTGPNSLKSQKLPSQHSILGHHRPASETTFKWCLPTSETYAIRLRADDGPLLVVFR